MKEAISESAIIGRGDVATVFDLRDGRVLKIYRPDYFTPGDARISMLHHEELRAYAMAASDALLSLHAAKCYGRLPVARVVDAHGADVSARYLVDLTICLERVPGSDMKYSLAVEEHPYLRAVCEAFRAQGLDAADASVFNADDVAACMFIDFTTTRGSELFGAMLSPGTSSQPDIANWLYGSGE